MSPLSLLLALSPTLGAAPSVPADEPPDLVDLPAHAVPIDGGWARPPQLQAEPKPQALGSKILFVNFEGAQMQWCGSDDPHNDCSTIFQGTVLPFSGDAVKRASVIQVIRKRVEDFGISVTDQRPASGDYDMEMVGNWQGEQPGFAGVAPNIDCFDQSGGETSFTLEMAQSADGIAEIVLQELAHTWGLEHVDEGSDLLYPTTSGSNKTFRDECYKIVSDTMLNPSNGYCNDVHTQFCQSGWQNSYQELLMVFGESTPDTTAPTVQILAPDDGADIEGGSFELRIGFSDDQTPAVIGATITVDGDALTEPVESTGAYAGPSELSFPIEGLPDGTYTISIEATDESDNPASDSVTITVSGNAAGTDEAGADDGPADESGTDDGGDASGDDEADDGDDDGDDDDGDGDDESGDDEAGQDETPASERGCACGVDAGAGSLAPGGLFALILAFRRRRRTDAPCRRT